MEPSLSQALHLMNGETVTNKIVEGGFVKRSVTEGKADRAILDELYLRCLSRKPTEDEVKAVQVQLKGVGDKKEDRISVLEDVFWALLNSKEFLFNH